MEAVPLSLDDAVVNACETVSHNLNGQKLGRKGRITRERILRATLELLEGPEEEPVTLSAVARKASLGMTSLYNYFDDLTELLIAVLEPVMATAQETYQAIAREYWPDDQLAEKCQEFVDAYHSFWFRYSRLLHLRNTMSDRGDERMMKYRMESTTPILQMLVRQMGEGEMRIGSAATSMVTMLFTGMERSITLVTDRQLSKLTGLYFGDEARFREPSARLMELAIRDCRNMERQ